MLQGWRLDPERIPENAWCGGAWWRGQRAGWSLAARATRFSDVTHSTVPGGPGVSPVETPRDTCADREGHPETQRRSTWPGAPATANAHGGPGAFYFQGTASLQRAPEEKDSKACAERKGDRGKEVELSPQPSVRGRAAPMGPDCWPSDPGQLGRRWRPGPPGCIAEGSLPEGLCHPPKSP